jgi:hypothetical protein
MPNLYDLTVLKGNTATLSFKAEATTFNGSPIPERTVQLVFDEAALLDTGKITGIQKSAGVVDFKTSKGDVLKLNVTKRFVPDTL